MPTPKRCRTSSSKNCANATLWSNRRPPLRGGGAVDDAQLKAFERIVVAGGAAGRAVASWTGNCAGFEAAGIFAIEAGAGDPRFLAHREAEQRRVAAGRAAHRPRRQPRRLDAAGAQPLVFDRRGARMARQDGERLDPRSRADPAGPVGPKEV